ncbi:hypothetical protein CORC01_03313 [Colletotrichum orchidophilum]|uniref:Uncharacterized protein n=1 Tax=Colletotrichum orchidophilum TaxID=1209926 RepID=A0A1G4BIF4_9PEZI|nr:uncharacterized protein CORC01_03313 [Colletotrichum orchidophilum]OHF01280.1 hypothetical protein CORC01_03313 [Colletotrichum orchidophilum]
MHLKPVPITRESRAKSANARAPKLPNRPTLLIRACMDIVVANRRNRVARDEPFPVALGRFPYQAANPFVDPQRTRTEAF